MKTTRIVGMALCVAAIGLLHCGSDPSSSTPPTQEQYLAGTPMPDQRAEEAAVVLSRQMVAPRALYERIHHDLQLIESKYGHAHPIDGVPFSLTWYPGVLEIKVSPEFEADSLHAGRRIMDSLNSLYHVGFVHSFDRWYGLGGEGRYNAVRLVEQYAIVPGLEVVAVVPVPVWDGIPGDPLFWVLPQGWNYKYFYYYGAETQNPYTVTNHLLYFDVIGQRTRLVDDWSYDALEPMDSVRPVWVDTLRMAQNLAFYWCSWTSTGGFDCNPDSGYTPR